MHTNIICKQHEMHTNIICKQHGMVQMPRRQASISQVTVPVVFSCALYSCGVAMTWCCNDLVLQWPGVAMTRCCNDLVLQWPGVAMTWCCNDLVLLTDRCCDQLMLFVSESCDNGAIYTSPNSQAESGTVRLHLAILGWKKACLAWLRIELSAAQHHPYVICYLEHRALVLKYSRQMAYLQW